MDRYKLVKTLIRRCSLSVVGKDDLDYPVVQATYFGRASNTHVINPYGLCTNPPKGSMGIMLLIGGDEENKAALFNSDPDRFRGRDGSGLKEGEVALSDYLSESYVWLKENGDIEIDAKNNAKINVIGDADITVGGELTATVTGNTTITTPLLTINGNLQLNGTFTGDSGGGTNTFTGDINIIGAVDATTDVTTGSISLNSHTHGGVQTGGGSTGGPQ